MLKRVVVIVSCGFRDKNTLCETTFARLNWAKNEARIKDPRLENTYFIPTGNVFREPGGPTLAQLQIHELTQRGISKGHVLIGDGVGMFSESKIVPKQIRDWHPDTKVVEVVSSNWYFQWEVRRRWKRNIREQGFIADICKIYGTGGWKTKAKYFAVYGLALSACALLDRILIPVFSVSAVYAMDVLLTQKQEIRKTEGFKFKCCE